VAEKGPGELLHIRYLNVFKTFLLPFEHVKYKKSEHYDKRKGKYQGKSEGAFRIK